MNRSLRLLAVLIIVVVSGCEGPEGPVGPQGDAGPAGQQGPAGPAGAVTVQTFSFTLEESGFVQGDDTEKFDRAAPEITQEIVDGGVVLAYTDLGSGGDAWFALPFLVPTPDIVATLAFAYTVGEFGIRILKDTTESLAGNYDGHVVRVVLIPPGAVASAKAGVDLSDYESVAKHFDLR